MNERNKRDRALRGAGAIAPSRWAATACALAALLVADASAVGTDPAVAPAAPAAAPSPQPSPASGRGGQAAGYPGMPPVLTPGNLYGSAGVNALSPATNGALSRVYVPELRSNAVAVIDPATRKVVGHFSGRDQSAAHRAVVGPADAVGDQ